MTNHQRTAAWLQACGKEPGAAALSTQIGCDLEELAEYLACLAFDKPLHQAHMQAIIEGIGIIGAHVKSGAVHAGIWDARRVEALDALCDREVTGNGVAYLAGMNKDAADQAVLASNDAKLVDGRPVLLEGGKIGKPEGWTAPDLRSFA